MAPRTCSCYSYTSTVRVSLLAILVLLAAEIAAQDFVKNKALRDPHGAYHRSDTSVQHIFLTFTAHDHYDGLEFVYRTLDSMQIRASFFLTGDFVRWQPGWVKKLSAAGHYVGAHSDKHLLYCDWTHRDSLLLTEKAIRKDISDNLREIRQSGIRNPKFFMPPYEWYNSAVGRIVEDMGLVMVNFTGGTSSNADYTTPEMKNYTSSDTIIARIKRFEQQNTLNGFHLLIHAGTDPARTDKLYLRLPELLAFLSAKGYRFKRF